MRRSSGTLGVLLPWDDVAGELRERPVQVALRSKSGRELCAPVCLFARLPSPRVDVLRSCRRDFGQLQSCFWTI